VVVADLEFRALGDFNPLLLRRHLLRRASATRLHLVGRPLERRDCRRARRALPAQVIYFSRHPISDRDRHIRLLRFLRDRLRVRGTQLKPPS